jgi:hypothetical protein
VISYGSGYSTEPHGETFYEEWAECSNCGARWDVNRPDDECECRELAEEEERNPEAKR